MYQDEDTFPIPRQIVGGGDLFLLKVAGDSSPGPGISHGDWVVVREQMAGGAGDRVAVMIGGDAVVRTFGDWLSDEVTILGKVVSVIHRT